MEAAERSMRPRRIAAPDPIGSNLGWRPDPDHWEVAGTRSQGWGDVGGPYRCRAGSDPRHTRPAPPVLGEVERRPGLRGAARPTSASQRRARVMPSRRQVGVPRVQRRPALIARVHGGPTGLPTVCLAARSRPRSGRVIAEASPPERAIRATGGCDRPGGVEARQPPPSSRGAVSAGRAAFGGSGSGRA